MQAKSSETSMRVWGHAIPQRIVGRLTSNYTLGLIEEGWLQATLGPAVAWMSVWFVCINSAFYSAMAGANAAVFDQVFRLGLILAVSWAIAGGVWHAHYRRSQRQSGSQQQRSMRWLVGLHRLFGLNLLLLFGFGSIVQSATIGPQWGLLSLGLVLFEGYLGYRLLPAMLAFLAGERQTAWRAAHLLDRVLTLMLGCISLISALTFMRNISGQIFFLMLCHIASTFAVPSAIALGAVALIFFRTARSA